MRAVITLTTMAVAALAVTPSLAAPAADKVLRGAVDPVPFGADAQVLAKFRGWARLVDGARRDTISIRVRGLRRNTPYLWHIHAVKAATTPDPCGAYVHHPPLAGGFKRYPVLETNGRGRARATAQGRRFRAKPAKLYYVNVDRASDGISVGCGVVAPVKPKPPASGGEILAP